MIGLTLDEAARVMGSPARPELAPLPVAGVSTDSRTVAPGELFFAIRGPNHDGHDFVVAALARGAVGAVVAGDRCEALRRQVAAAASGPERGAAQGPASGEMVGAPRPVGEGRPAAGGEGSAPPVLISVDDPLTALGRLAAYHRRRLTAPVIAVVGSNGKTTTKNMIDRVLSGRLRGRCARGSFNNAVGVPLTLLSARPDDEYLVVEIGTNRPGEVGELGRMVAPDLAVLTCLGAEHLEGLGDLEGVAREECSILQTLRPGGWAVVNIDSPLVRPWLDGTGVAVCTFGLAADADVRVVNVRADERGVAFELEACGASGGRERFAYRVPLLGVHNAVNAAGAAAAGCRLGLSHEEMARRLEGLSPAPMRMEVQRVGGVTVINDAYNCNPHSAQAAIETLEQFPTCGRRILVFGEMRELGPQSGALHREVAGRLRRSRLDRVLLVGPLWRRIAEELRATAGHGPEFVHQDDPDECAHRLAQELRGGDVLMLKASRAVGLEQVLEGLRAHLERVRVG